MKKADTDEINSFLKQVKNKLLLEIDEFKLIKEVTEISAELQKKRQDKEYFETLKRLLDLISREYFYCLDGKTINKIGELDKKVDKERNELIRDIFIKTQRLADFELLIDFVSYDDFDSVAEIHTRKNK